MKKQTYFCEGVLPYDYVETAFEKLGRVQKGRLMSAMVKTSREMWNLYEREFFRYTYELEGYINSIAASQPDKNFRLQKILEEAVHQYFLDLFHDNIYTFLEGYVKKILIANGIVEKEIKEADIYSLIGYVDEEEYNISDLKRRVCKYVCQKKAFR